jgi:hypothetical protein
MNLEEAYRNIVSPKETKPNGFDAIVEELMNERKAVMTKIEAKLGMELEKATPEDIENSELTPKEKEMVYKFLEYRQDIEKGFPK